MNSTAGIATVSDVGKPEDETRAEAGVSSVSAATDRVAAFLATDPELDSRLPAIEEKIREHFGPEARIERTIFSPMDEENAPDQFHLRVIADMDLDERIERLKALIGDEHELLAPVRPQLTIGIL
ncbi:MAG: hypothetical protein JWO14_3585 [Solirubrobacterales bacterium]|nr:hypothetical protein [Solirubrobacterales bacterium]